MAALANLAAASPSSWSSSRRRVVVRHSRLKLKVRFLVGSEFFGRIGEISEIFIIFQILWKVKLNETTFAGFFCLRQKKSVFLSFFGLFNRSFHY